MLSVVVSGGEPEGEAVWGFISDLIPLWPVAGLVFRRFLALGDDEKVSGRYLGPGGVIPPAHAYQDLYIHRSVWVKQLRIPLLQTISKHHVLALKEPIVAKARYHR